VAAELHLKRAAHVAQPLAPFRYPFWGASEGHRFVPANPLLRVNRTYRIAVRISTSNSGCVIVRLPHPLIVEWMLWQHAVRRSDRDTIVDRVRGIMQFANEVDGSPVTAQPADITQWLDRHGDWSEAVRARHVSYLQSWFSWLCLMDHRSDDPTLRLAASLVPTWCHRNVDIVDQELRLLTTVRAPRSLGGRQTAVAVDQLLDERLAILTSAAASDRVPCASPSPAKKSRT
jgi:hypothetical protein